MIFRQSLQQENDPAQTRQKDESTARSNTTGQHSLMEKLFHNLKSMTEEASLIHAKSHSGSEGQENQPPLQMMGRPVISQPSNSRNFGQSIQTNQLASQRSSYFPEQQSMTDGNPGLKKQSVGFPHKQSAYKDQEGFNNLSNNQGKQKATMSLHEPVNSSSIQQKAFQIYEEKSGKKDNEASKKPSLFYNSEQDSSLERFTKFEEIVESEIGEREQKSNISFDGNFNDSSTEQDCKRLSIFGQKLPDSSYEGEEEEDEEQAEDDGSRHDQSEVIRPNSTIKESSEGREDSGMVISSEDKRALLQKLKENFTKNGAFDCFEFAMDDSHKKKLEDSLDIDDRRVLFESEVRKQIHRNVPFDETEQFNKMELLHRISKNSRDSYEEYSSSKLGSIMVSKMHQEEEASRQNLNHDDHEESKQEAEDQSICKTVTMRSAGDQQIEALKNMFFESDEEKLSNLNDASEKVSRVSQKSASKISRDRSKKSPQSQNKSPSVKSAKKKSSVAIRSVHKQVDQDVTKSQVSMQSDHKLQPSVVGNIQKRSSIRTAVAMANNNLSCSVSINHNGSEIAMKHSQDDQTILKMMQEGSKISQQQGQLKRPSLAKEFSGIQNHSFSLAEEAAMSEMSMKSLSNIEKSLSEKQTSVKVKIPARPMMNSSLSSSSSMPMQELTQYYLDGGQQQSGFRQSFSIINKSSVRGRFKKNSKINFEDASEFSMNNAEAEAEMNFLKQSQKSIEGLKGLLADTIESKDFGFSQELGLSKELSQVKGLRGTSEIVPNEESGSAFFSGDHQNPFPSMTMDEQRYLLDNLTEVLRSDFKDRKSKGSTMVPAEQVEFLKGIIMKLEEENYKLKSKFGSSIKKSAPSTKKKNTSRLLGAQRVSTGSQERLEFWKGCASDYSDEELEIIDFKTGGLPNSTIKKQKRKVSRSKSLSKENINMNKPKRSNTPQKPGLSPSSQTLPSAKPMPTEDEIKYFKDLLNLVPKSTYSQIYMRRRCKQ